MGWRISIFCLILASAADIGWATDRSVEFAVKAAFIFKFIPYVEWPSSTFRSPDAPLNVCVAGSDGVSAQLDEAAPGQRAGGHPVVLRHLSAAEPDAGCNILYVAESDPEAATDDLNALRGAPVLTVTDGNGPPGIIAFTIIGNHVRFDIDEAAATAGGLVISSKLLSLAHVVRQKP
jgi:hypothetical protein